MSEYNFQQLDLEEWKDTRDFIQSMAGLCAGIKAAFTPHQKNWEEHSLKVYAKGLTTTTIPVIINGSIETLDLNLNLIEHSLKIFCGRARLSVPFENQSSLSFAKETVRILNELGVEYGLKEDDYSNSNMGSYDKAQAENYWHALKQIYFILLEFKGGLMEETSNINFWPHHFDLAMLWFSGRLIPGKDPSDWDHSREQMNFGFSTGDKRIPEPYIYITAYPFNEELIKTELPENAYWLTEGWKGAVIKYSKLTNKDNPEQILGKLFNDLLTLNKALISK